MAKLKQHQISSLRESQNQSIEEKQPLLSEKARPTPRKRNVKPNLEPVRNAMNQETPLVVNATKVKSLFLQIPDKAARCSRTPGSELCSEVKKNLKIDCGRRLEGSSAMSSKKHQGSCVASKSCKRLTKNGARFMEIAVGQVKENCTNQNKDISEKDQASRHAKMDNDSKESVKPNNVVSMNLDRHQVCNGEGGNGRRTWCNITDNENKENLLVIHENRDITSNAANFVDKSSNEESKNPPPEGAKVQGKPFKDHSLQGRKLKKLTNPKPFRLRTDERGILKEANLERKLQAEFMKEPASQVQKKETICRTNLVRTPEAKLAKNNQICMNDNKKKKQEFVPRVCKEKGGSIKLPRLEQGVEAKGYVGCVQGRKKSATIPSEPKFHKIHVPKSCTKGLVHHEILKRQ
ncbi:hypothetical protein HPP92_019573 [Vanilla planifolia]|uniref:Uncharacterized protein n=1 Tax=Vanilla planifolia TaxID=51239 RepID=A0A835Q0U3_VANPL|nr:hypothetical protein HPP92_019573 [Vanilla planifolia]